MLKWKVFVSEDVVFVIWGNLLRMIVIVLDDIIDMQFINVVMLIISD